VINAGWTMVFNALAGALYLAFGFQNELQLPLL
jgi:hypothetical protein